jgi:hypothetical protein
MALVTQSFGRENEYRRVLITILSFYAHSSRALPTILFTDNPEWFKPYLGEFPVQYVLLTPEKVKVMRGEIDFLHRMKIALIEEAFTIAGDTLFYADSDTFFIEDPMKLYTQASASTSFMHVWEYQFESLRNMPLPGGATFQAFLNLVERKSFDLPDGTQLKVLPSDSSWNAGVMILHQSHKLLIPSVYSLTEQFFPETRNHASEQYAFSILLQQRTELKPCEAVIYHYWYHVKKKIADSLSGDVVHTLQGLSKQQKLDQIKALTASLPGIFESHVYAFKDNAVQSFNENKYREAYRWVRRAFLKGAFKDITFVKDTLYHTKRLLKGK